MTALPVAAVVVDKDRMRPSVPLVRIEAVGLQMRAQTWAQKRRMIAELLVGQVLRHTH